MVIIDQEKCIGCGSCVKDCCMGVLTVADHKAAKQPRRRCIECLHCAAVCPRQAISFDDMDAASLYAEPSDDMLAALITARKSVRHFSNELPSKELIQKAMNLSMYAPSGKNQRAYHYTVIYGAEQVAALRDQCLALCAEFGEAPELPKLFAKGTDLLTCGAPCMIVLSSPDDCLNPILDPAVAMAQLELSLIHEGLGTCWGGYLRQVSDRFKEIREVLNVPENSHVRCALMVGYPAKNLHYRNSVRHPEAQAYWIE